MEREKELEALRAQIKEIADSHNELTMRTMALQSVVEVLAWGTWHSREQLAERLLESGQQSLAAVNTLPERMQRAVISVWNQAHAQLANPDAGVSFIGVRPPDESGQK
ncbi:hypothetical protein [Xanthomonas sacchari]|uniref:hypothetical protein n=1 Tax=Xanthomonas sacchari TaxID=56458 RepID=UPI00225645FB|nr:hypothetical protein [Xanthomonas sacchari]MCW0447238.1 hypothetical protein [Xanthomonas sacchari]